MGGGGVKRARQQRVAEGAEIKVEEKEAGAKLDWFCDCFCTDCYSWQGRSKSSQAPVTLRGAKDGA